MYFCCIKIYCAMMCEVMLYSALLSYTVVDSFSYRFPFDAAGHFQGHPSAEHANSVLLGAPATVVGPRACPWIQPPTVS